MTLGMTHGEMALVAWIFGLVYVAGLLPKIAARLAGDKSGKAAPSPLSSTSSERMPDSEPARGERD